MNLITMLQEVAAHFPDKTAIVSGERRLSYAELEMLSARFAAGLAKAGICKGDRVALLMPNSSEFVIAYFGTVRLGAVAVPLDTKYKTLELERILGDCRPVALIANAACRPVLSDELLCCLGIKSVVWMGAGVPEGGLTFEEMLVEKPSTQVENISDDDIAHIAYTSGPSLKPRGIVVTHGNLVRVARITSVGFGQTDKDIVLLFALPLHHVIGLVVVLLGSIASGSTVVMLSGLSMESLLATIRAESVTMLLGVPFVHAVLVQHVKKTGDAGGLISLRFCGSCGAPLPPVLARDYRQFLGRPLVDFYGLTEATSILTVQRSDGTPVGSVGRALPGFEVGIVDRAGTLLLVGCRGEVVIRGPIMAGYYNKPVATGEVIKDGWLYTGDTGYLDAEGNLYLTGIIKLMLICKGQNIYFSDIEDVLATHPAVADVAVTGMPDPEGLRGEVVLAAVVLQPGQRATEAELKHFCLERLANYKAPKRVLFLASLPHDASGAVDRAALLAQAG